MNHYVPTLRNLDNLILLANRAELVTLDAFDRARDHQTAAAEINQLTQAVGRLIAARRALLQIADPFLNPNPPAYAPRRPENSPTPPDDDAIPDHDASSAPASAAVAPLDLDAETDADATASAPAATHRVPGRDDIVANDDDTIIETNADNFHAGLAAPPAAHAATSPIRSPFRNQPIGRSHADSANPHALASPRGEHFNIPQIPIPIITPEQLPDFLRSTFQDARRLARRQAHPAPLEANASNHPTDTIDPIDPINPLDPAPSAADFNMDPAGPSSPLFPSDSMDPSLPHDGLPLRPIARIMTPFSTPAPTPPDSS